MKVIVIRSNLKEGITIAERAIGENLNLPILKNILFEAEGSKIKITATNLEIAITTVISGKVIETGKFTVPAGIFSNLINNIQSDRLNVEDKKGRMEIKTDNYEASVQGMTANDFPITPKIKETKEFIEIKSALLKEALNQILVAAQFSDVRQELNNIFFDFSTNAIKLVATDSFRLAEKTIASQEFSTNHTEKFSVLIPLKTAQELARILKENEIVKIYHDENQILFKTEQTELLSRLSEGSFPDYAAVIPKEFAAEIVFSREEFLSALRLAGIFGSRTSEVKLKPHESKKVVEVTSADQALGENNYMLPAKIQGKFGEIVFNWRYIADVLKTLKTEDVWFGVNSENEPAEIKSPGDASYLYILKPIAE
ncbi:MAG: DNA polymerase III subunit beta [Candidatus Liptonbacteria bacterium RIFCSPLOWO2_01_FULL_52_25]|uniref:Beta sliding clamp n=1 Tax=Candidatus Liptonbacteria bacterium RIFCSPLOWO2_01_FULL_52_25 TaxID=1798650 RepID=A0A1G2CEJ3_9BACT|nr:MAG: DNA polymerase III subunit beta [Candidatus Liptonbacteria bacterium RIFCSPLOWO2_01_FULL_52_25]